MKKLCLILITLLLTGCYDYKEINELALISSIGIDYKDDNYEIIFELLNDSKSSEQGATASTYIVNDKGTTIAEAFDNIALRISKIPYYYHLDAVILSQEVATNHFEETIEYLVRQPMIRNEFYIVLSDVEPSKIIENSTAENPVIGSQIDKLIGAGESSYNPAYTKPFENIIENILNKRKEPIVNTLTLKDKTIALKGLAIFKDYTYVTTLTDQHADILGLLLGETDKVILTNYYNDKPFTIKTYSSKVAIEIKDQEVQINVTAEAEIEENVASLDLRDENTFKKLNKDYSKILNEQIKGTIKELVDLNVDALGLRDIYYKKFKKNNNNILQDYEIKVTTDLRVNKRGLIYEVNDER